MRHLLLIAILAPACASAPTASTTPTTPIVSHAQVAPVPVSIAEDDSDSATPTYQSDDSYYPPYALLFHEGQKWDFSVQLAMASTGQPTGEQKMINCEVQHIEYMCDRRVSNISCSDGNKVVAGNYTANLNGMWRQGFAEATAELDENTRAFERVPQPNMHTTQIGKTWCSSDGGTTLCVEDGKGLVGASMISTTGEEMIVGTIPSA
jgi:hypothetical protein